MKINISIIYCEFVDPLCTFLTKGQRQQMCFEDTVCTQVLQYKQINTVDVLGCFGKTI